MDFDVIVVGAGASGLFSSILLGREGLSVLVVEQNSQAGKKLALCGGGFCNMGPRERTPEELTPRYQHFTVDKKTQAQVYKPLHKLKNLFFDLTPALVIQVFSASGEVKLPVLEKGSAPVVVQALGIECKEEGGKLFPRLLDAPGLSQKLYALALGAGVKLKFNEKVTGLSRDGVWTVHTGPGVAYRSRSLFLATGGAAYPGAGGTQDGADWLTSLRVPTVEGRASMGSLALLPHPFKHLSGLSLRVRLVVKVSGSKVFSGNPDTMLLTHKGLSGPAVLDICGLVHKNQDHKPSLELDLLPETDEGELVLSWDVQSAAHPKKQISNFLSFWVPNALGQVLLDQLEIPHDKPVGTLSQGIKQKIQKTLKSWEVFPSLPTPWNQTMSWTGGCDPGVINWKTMEIREHPGLFVLGDLVSLDRPCGGYSLFFAWTSALAACRKVLTRADAT